MELLFYGQNWSKIRLYIEINFWRKKVREIDMTSTTVGLGPIVLINPEFLRELPQISQLEAEFGAEVLENLERKYSVSMDTSEDLAPALKKEGADHSRFDQLKKRFGKVLGGLGISAGSFLVVSESEVFAHIPDGMYDCTNTKAGQFADHIDSEVDANGWDVITYVCKIDTPPPATTVPAPVETLPPPPVTPAPTTPKPPTTQKPVETLPPTLPPTTVAPETTTTLLEVLATSTTESTVVTTTTEKLNSTTITSEASTSTSGNKPAGTTTTTETNVIAGQSDRNDGLSIPLLWGGGAVAAIGLAFGIRYWRHDEDREKQPPIQPINLV